VNNNSSPAIDAYLAAHQLDRYVSNVVGREFYHPERMKPDPRPATQAMRALRSGSHHAVVIGDSRSDVTSGRQAGVPVIGYVSRAGKEAQL
jgi:HAD superfamily hydrolase (TIGR01509 family)